MILLIYIIESQ